MACLDTLLDEVFTLGSSMCERADSSVSSGGEIVRGDRDHGALDAHNAVRALGAHVQVIRECARGHLEDLGRGDGVQEDLTERGQEGAGRAAVQRKIGKGSNGKRGKVKAQDETPNAEYTSQNSDLHCRSSEGSYRAARE